MGIPGLYRWLVARYPNTLCSVVDDSPQDFMAPGLDSTRPNPNGVEFDNLYIDMNGIIHPCFHPETLPAPWSYDEVFEGIFSYIEKVFSIVRPRKLLFLAVDGVAPRAKMNHQRIRRFRAAKEAGCNARFHNRPHKEMDSNVITPGTEFMDLLSSALKYFVHLMMNVNPAWRNIKVILSDSSVVGEGEHKIMYFIRSQRNLPGYDPNTRHCLHGLDADLIMLALATHEIHFSILREVSRSRMTDREKRRLRSGTENYALRVRKYIHTLKFEFFNIWVLREYLERELLPNAEEKDVERLVDDFVFMCLFVGNDFLPHLPSLDISKGGIELLLTVYQQEFDKMGYLTDSSTVNLKQMEHFVQALGFHEKAILMKRTQIEMGKEMKKNRQKRKATRGSRSNNNQPRVLELQSRRYSKPTYYIEKFDVVKNSDADRIQRNAVLKYTEGVCWVMHYYYQGVCSWQWFYPYHYAPLASDFRGLDKLEVRFTLGQPLKPLDQLLAVMPAASAQALPLCYRELMIKQSSPILDFYPKDAVVDKNGKKRVWQGVCKLPFIEESRLLSAIVKVEHTLSDKEKKRNKLGKDRLFVHLKHTLAGKIKNHPLSDPSSEVRIKIKPELSGGMNGYVRISEEPVCPRVIHSPVSNRRKIKQNSVISVYYECPSFGAHISKLLDGVIMPPRILRCQDIPDPPVLWHETPELLESSVCENPIKKRKIEPTKQDEVLKSCVDNKMACVTEPEVHDHCVDKTSAVEVEKICGASQHSINVDVGKNLTNMMGTDLPSSKKQEIIGRDNEHVINDELKTSTNVEVCERVNKTDSDSSSTRKIQILGSGNESDACVRTRKQKKKRVKGVEPEAELDLAEGGGKVNEAISNSIDVDVCEKLINKVESDLWFAKEEGEELHLVNGTEKVPTDGIQSILSTNNEQKHMDGENEPVGKKKRERSVQGHNLGAELCLVGGNDKINEASQNKIEVEVGEKPMNRLLGSDLHLAEEKDKTTDTSQCLSNVEAGEKPAKKLRSDLGGECEEDARGEPKRKKHKKRKHVDEAELVGEKVETKGANRNSNVFVVSEKPTNILESDLPIAMSEGEPKRKKGRKRKLAKGDIGGGA